MLNETAGKNWNKNQNRKSPKNPDNTHSFLTPTNSVLSNSRAMKIILLYHTKHKYIWRLQTAHEFLDAINNMINLTLDALNQERKFP